jgi:hypothetical protein
VDPEVDVTEITELQATKVSGVASPANGTPFLVLKATAPADEKDCSTCKGSGKIREGNLKCPDCNGSGVEKSDSAEADAEEDEVTGSKAEKAKWDALDKTLSAADRDKMPASSFAYVDPKGGKHLPIHDESHVKSALGRFGQQDFSDAKDPAGAKTAAASKIKTAAKKFGVDVDNKSEVAEVASKSTGVPDESVQEPKEAGHLATGQSGTSGTVTDGTVPAEGDSSQALGGRNSYIIPDEAKVTDQSGVIPNTTDAKGLVNPQAVAKAVTVASLSEAIDQISEQRAAIKDGKYLEATGAATQAPGSMPWETYDAATLAQVSLCLAGCCSALDNIQQRERIEAASGNPSDMEDAWDLEEAASALEFALGVAARLSFHEAAEGEAAKSGRTLSGKNVLALNAARDHLNAVIDGAEKQAGSSGKTDTSEEENIVTTVTKDELAETIAASSVAAVKAVLKEQKKAAKKAAEEAAEKNANNGGDIATGDIKPTGEVSSDDITAIPDGGKVDPQYVNKSEAGEPDPLTKQVADQLEVLTKGLESVEETVAKIAKRPRAGGPSLDGQARGSSPAAEGRLGDVTKSEGDEIEKLEKALESETNPSMRDGLQYQLVRARLTKAHEEGRV